MEYAIEVLEADLERCKQEIGFDCNTTKWQQRIYELETAIQKQKVESNYEMCNGLELGHPEHWIVDKNWKYCPYCGKKLRGEK